MMTQKERNRTYERIKRCEWEIGALRRILDAGRCVIDGVVFTADEMRDTFADKIAVIEAEIHRLTNQLKEQSDD